MSNVCACSGNFFFLVKSVIPSWLNPWVESAQISRADSIGNQECPTHSLTLCVEIPSVQYPFSHFYVLVPIKHEKAHTVQIPSLSFNYKNHLSCSSQQPIS